MQEGKVDISAILQKRVRERTEALSQSRQLNMAPMILDAGAESLRMAMAELDAFVELIEACRLVINHGGGVDAVAKLEKTLDRIA